MAATPSRAGRYGDLAPIKANRGQTLIALAACRTWKPISVAGPCHQIPLLTKIKIF
jgi:hypothetical protein